MRISSYVFAAFALSAAPAFAQTIDFGTDTSQWSNDGECDDPRFTGPGMTTTTLLDADIRADATDCKTAFDAGSITLAGGDTVEPPAIPDTPVAPDAPVVPAGINFGDDSGDWPKDGECDDRRFFGGAMASNLGWEFVGRDATDCKAALQAGSIAIWNEAASMAATQCTAIDFGDDTGPYPNDSECDDVRFEGRGTASVLNLENLGKDASDCSAQCTFGIVSLRDY
jgi:hypothetical protein